MTALILCEAQEHMGVFKTISATELGSLCG